MTQKKTGKKPARRKAAPVKVKRRAAPKVKALAIADAVLREDVHDSTRNGLQQITFAWSPFGLLAAQVAFWEGFMGGTRVNAPR